MFVALPGLTEDLSTTQFDASLLIDFRHLNHDLLAFLQHIRYTFNALLGNLGDMHQAVSAGHDLDKGAKIGDFLYLATIDFSYLRLCCDAANHLDGRLRGCLIS